MLFVFNVQWLVLFNKKANMTYIIFSCIRWNFNIKQYIKTIVTYTLTHIQYNSRIYYRENYASKEAIYQIHDYLCEYLNQAILKKHITYYDRILTILRNDGLKIFLSSYNNLPKILDSAEV